MFLFYLIFEDIILLLELSTAFHQGLVFYIVPGIYQFFPYGNWINSVMWVKKKLFCNIISVINHIHTYVGMFLHSILFHWSLFLSLYKYITVLKITLKTQSLTPSGVYKSSYLFSPLSTWFWRLCMCMCFWAVFLFYWSIFLIPYQTLTYWYFIIHPDVYRLKPLTLFIFF